MSPYILSLTSYEPRFHSLYQVISEIPTWEVIPSKLILNLTSKDMTNLKYNLELGYPIDLQIQIVEDLGPAKKLIPSLPVQGNLPIVTIDDDIHYPPNLITKVLIEHMLFPTCIIAGRAHKILFDDGGDMLPYLDWHGETQVINGPSKELFPTGAGMILYPPNSLHSDVFDTDTYKKNCLYADDIWFYFQARRAGTLVRRAKHGIELKYVKGSQEIGLWQLNSKRNDIYLKNLVEIYGNPLFMN